MKKLLLITVVVLSGCSSLPGILNNDPTACLEAQKSMSRDHTMRDIAILEMAKTANEQTKMAAMTVISQNKMQSLACK